MNENLVLVFVIQQVRFCCAYMKGILFKDEEFFL
jgi:hypothetical protein